ncbi:MAG: response regulator [Armatimonadetes bacterium]|nr:response regulator [Armatimonadota bacterium]
MKTILLVEDDDNERYLYERELREEGYRVMTARDGREAIAKVEEESPDLVVLDINMPQMDGLDAMGKILDRDRKVPVIINTAYSSYKDSFMSWAADAYVIKSGNLEELKHQIRAALQKSETHTH